MSIFNDNSVSEITDNPVMAKNLKGKWLLIIGVLAGLLMIVVPSVISGLSDNKAASAAPNTESESTYYTEFLEEKIQKLCMGINGIGSAEVLLTLDSSSEYVYAANSAESADAEHSSISKDYLIIENKDGSGETVMVSEIYPKIRGVAVVCTGGDTAEVQKTVTELLSAALGISSARIKVAGTG